MKYNIGDIVELIPGNCPNGWFEGTGVILGENDNKYQILFSEFSKTDNKKLYTTYYGSIFYQFDIEMANENEIFKILG